MAHHRPQPRQLFQTLHSRLTPKAACVAKRSCNPHTQPKGSLKTTPTIMTILSLENASFAVGHVPLLDHTSFQLAQGEKIGLIGRNGAGKSSFKAA